MGVYALSNPNINLLSLLTENKDSKFNLLDVGCYDGSNLKVLRQQYINSNLYGVDIDNTVLSYADQYGSTYCVDIEKNTLPFQHNFFDYILCGDVLEHLHNPVLVLNNLKLFLKDDGMFIISLPNLMHVSVLFQLLNGRFVYEDAGLLDKYHNYESFCLACNARGKRNPSMDEFKEFRNLPLEKQKEYFKNISK